MKVALGPKKIGPAWVSLRVTHAIVSTFTSLLIVLVLEAYKYCKTIENMYFGHH